MFSGIVEEIGTVRHAEHTPEKSMLTIEADTSLQDTRIGDSIAVNGACLTVCSHTNNSFVVEAIPETIRLTNLGNLNVGSPVNLERSITPTTRIGGHLIQGHVDGATTIECIEQNGCAIKVWFKKLDTYSECFIPKGYICIDGMSLTVVDVTPTLFSICFIPHTQAVTIVKQYQVGTQVNVEIDHITKTVSMILKAKEAAHALDY